MDFRHTLFFLVSLFLFATPLSAQTTPPIIFHTEVREVRAPFIVIDENGKIVENLTKQDFTISEDGVEQRIIFCSSDPQPVSFIIILDVSVSMKERIPFVREAGLALIDPRYPKDEFMIVSFESKIRLVSPFSNDAKGLRKDVEDYILPTEGATALSDAIYFGVTKGNYTAHNARRTAIVISDGEGNHERWSERDVISLLKEADMPLFGVTVPGTADWDILGIKKNKPMIPVIIPAPKKNVIFTLTWGKDKDKSKDEDPEERDRRSKVKLERYTSVTGGVVFPIKRPEDLVSMVQEIGLAVRHQYTCSYTPEGVEHIVRKENFHSMKVSLRDKGLRTLHQLRWGYYRIAQ